MDEQVASALRDQILEICFATGFLVVGLVTFSIAAIRRNQNIRVFLWLGSWSAGYGLMHLLSASAVVSSLPPWLRVAAPYVEVALAYCMVILGSMAWVQLIRGGLRRAVLVLVIAAVITAILGIGSFIVTGRPYIFLSINNWIAACVLALLLLLVSSKRLFDRYLALPTRGLLAFGTFLFAAEALWANLARPFNLNTWVVLDHLGFAALLTGFGHSALRMVLANEHRLLTLDSELEVARQIQASILPTEVPQLRNLRIAALYEPMTAVAGDFYEFLPVDQEHLGILVADVCGHGVPAALIASMLKVAVQSAAANAPHPGKFLAELNRILAAPLRGQLVSAAYLWVDTNTRTARYAAAGHPPLLRWNAHGLERMESNGLLFGVLPEAEYPDREFSLHPGIRVLLYTDGITEPENSDGIAFGDRRLAEVLGASRQESPAALATRIVREIGEWQGDSTAQQDDRTLIVIDVLRTEPASIPELADAGSSAN